MWTSDTIAVVISMLMFGGLNSSDFDVGVGVCGRGHFKMPRALSMGWCWFWIDCCHYNRRTGSSSSNYVGPYSSHHSVDWLLHHRPYHRNALSVLARLGWSVWCVHSHHRGHHRCVPFDYHRRAAAAANDPDISAEIIMWTSSGIAGSSSNKV